MKKTSKRVLAIVLALVMALSVFSVSAFAASDNYNANYQSETHTVFKHTEQTLAPGVEYYNNYAYSSDGKQMVYYVATADISRDDVVVQTSYLNQYKDQQPGMSKLSEQVAFANQYYTDPTNPLYLSDYYNVVAGVNASFYNMQTGQPTGVCYVDGTSFGNTSYPAFFAILKDAEGKQTAIMDDTKNVGNYDNIWQAVGGQYWLVRDGVDVTADASGAYLTDRHSRTVVGITDDGKVVLMVLDGRQEPFSCGGTMHELAQIMIEAGCKYAMNIDGGGSTTFGSRPEGEDDFRVINRPSDGSERSISSGLIIGSLTAPSDVFDRVSIDVADEYITPGTATDIYVAGVSPAGTSADIPAEVTYEATLGSVVDGRFVSDGTAGDAVISAVYNGDVVGTATVHVVVPDAIDITSDSVTIPYGKSAEIPVALKYGLNEVAYKAADFTVTVEDSGAGTLDGLTFTAAAENDITSTTVTVALNGTDLSDSATLLFGKGSEVIFDFEDGTTNNFRLTYSNYNYYLPNSRVFVADKDNGKVHSGNYALGLNIDYSNNQESGYQMIGMSQGTVSGNVNYYEDAQKLGAWIYIPDEYVGLWVRWTVSPISAITENAETGEKSYSLSSITAQTMDNTAGGTGIVNTFDESGWHYIWADLSQYKGLAWRDLYYCMQFYISDRDGAGYGYYAKNQHNINGDFTVYMDDITVDYSTVVEDREAPVFQSVLLGDRGPHSNDALTLTNGYDSDGYSQLSLSARVAENTAKSNATGINASSAKAYIDGNEVSCTYANGLMSIDEYDFAEGQHSVKFVIYDNAGNRASATRKFTVSNATKSEAVKVVAHDPSLDRILHGSLYWVDVVAENAENIDTVTTTLNLDSMSKWEIEHMTVADGFKASYEVVDAGDKIVKLTITSTGNVNIAGEQALVSIPVRAWELDNSVKKAALSNKEWTYAQFKASKEFWPVATEVRVQQGAVTFTDGSSDYFTGDDVFVWSESWANYANMTATQEGKDYFNAWDGGHIHTAEPTTINAVSATCTEKGYTGDQFCDVCNSIIKWGEEIPATGHSYDFVDDVLKCTVCGELFNGEYTDGKVYVDGVLAQGFVDGKYYIDGEAQEYTGIVIVDEKYYEFDENHNSLGLYTGLVDIDGVNYYSKLGVLSSGWYEVDGDWYLFDETTLAGVDGTWKNECRVTFEFENGKVLDGAWEKTIGKYRYWYGPTYYHLTSRNVAYLEQEVDGATYLFDEGGYRATGIVANHESNSKTLIWYDCGEDGKATKLTGPMLLENNNKLYYVNEEGKSVSDYGLVLFEGDYYYQIYDGSLKRNGDRTVSAEKANGLLPAGTYNFGADGKMTNAPVINGIGADGYYRENGEIVKDKGLVYIDGAYYFVVYTGKIKIDADRTVTEEKSNGLLPAGLYHFGPDGKMTNVPVLDGIGADGYYRENGEIVADKGLIKIDGDYYYVIYNGKIKKDGDRTVTAEKANGLLPAGTYHFGVDGKMTDAPVLDGIGADGYYRENGVIVENKGLIKIGDDYYYVIYNGKIKKNGLRTVTAEKANGLLPAGDYFFGADGKMANGFIEEDGVLHYYIGGKLQKFNKLTEIDGAYYYIRSNGEVVRDKMYLVWNGGGIVEDQTYHEFDADGKMVE